MKKIFIILFLLLCIIPQNSNTYALTKSQYYEQIILNEVKQNEKIQLSEKELKQAITNTKNEIFTVFSDVTLKGYKTTHKCYPNSVIKQVTIYTATTVLNRYFDAHGNWIGDIEYYRKDNTLAKAYLKESITSRNYNSNQTQDKTSRIGNMTVSYCDDKISRIGDMNVSYCDGKISRIGDMNVSYCDGKISRIGDMNVSYCDGKISRIGDMNVSYCDGKISRIGDMNVSY